VIWMNNGEVTLRKEIIWITLVTLFVNLFVLIASIVAGDIRGNVSFYFKEREAVTLFSAIQLAASSLIALQIFIIRKKYDRKDGYWFWFLCSFGFLWLMCDELFMIHEGIDDGILGALGYVPSGKHFLYDWIVIALYGAAALVLSVKYQREIVKSRTRILFFVSAGLFYVAQTGIDAFAIGATQMVVEESLKLVSVCLFFLFFITVFFEVIGELLILKGNTEARTKAKTETRNQAEPGY